MAQMYHYDSMSEGSQHSQGMQFVPFKTTTASSRPILLHGNLDVWVKEAKNLPNMDLVNNSIGDIIGSLSGKLQTSDPYVTIAISGAVIARTFVIKDNENPFWGQHFHVPVAHYGTEVQFVVKDNDIVGSEIMGVVAFAAERLVSGSRIDGTYPILGANRKPCNPGAVLSLSVQYVPIDKVPVYQGGVGSDLLNQGVSGTYFPMRRGGSVTLYQDAHVPEGCIPSLVLANGEEYRHAMCWRDIYDAISQARRLVYITGWSVYHLVQLVRDDVRVRNSSLGEILKAKSQEGVRVLLLVWDDPTSTSILGYKTVRTVSILVSFFFGAFFLTFSKKIMI
ncbi:PREDICTED: phospholipase D gamma 1-like [Erythranthe guttata]|uniref:phospholipase D gamma 1-like n=1 Tax=Erythranthe guttata TaxID=4155 RepID=UPI00064E05D8|nr:PREDICTED: phospholipase D gamma 1-like [Erythranthe guttata]|eukprot:XP_012835455.1 PREDICTED: phospholipase D gamma 1-like [Erythranthe guttata]